MWQKENKEKMAQYARKYYHKRCIEDPEYKIKLCNKVKANYVHNFVISKNRYGTIM